MPSVKKSELPASELGKFRKKYVTKIIETEFWDNCIRTKDQPALLVGRAPLYVEMLEVEDLGLRDSCGNYQHLSAIIELFSENEIRVITMNGANVVTRIRADMWHDGVSHFP